MQSTSPQEEHSLAAYLETLHKRTLPLHDTIEAMGNLLPNLTTSVSPTGTRLISIDQSKLTPDLQFTGEADLDVLGRIFLESADRCTREHASFETRLLHVSLEDSIAELYGANEDLLREGLKNKTVKFPWRNKFQAVGCACCRGDPDAVILANFHEGEALIFWEDEYKAIFGDEKDSGGLYGATRRWTRASKKQVERKAEEEKKAESKL